MWKLIPAWFRCAMTPQSPGLQLVPSNTDDPVWPELLLFWCKRLVVAQALGLLESPQQVRGVCCCSGMFSWVGQQNPAGTWSLAQDSAALCGSASRLCSLFFSLELRELLLILTVLPAGAGGRVKLPDHKAGGL